MIDGRRGDAKVPANDSQVAEENAGPASGQAPLADQNTVSADGAQKDRRLPRIELGRRLVAHGIKADHVTLFGVLIAAVTGYMIAVGQLWVGVALVITGGLMDTLDGAVAKAAGTSSKRGAFFDSVTDRVADGLIFGGLAWYFAAGPGHDPRLALLPIAILAVGNVISYERAKAESLGYVAKGGLMERAERLILLGAALTFHWVLVPLLWLLLALCVFTALQRFAKVWRQATNELRGIAPSVRPAQPDLRSTHGRPVADGTYVRAFRPARVESRWREWREATAANRRPRLAPQRTARSRRRDEPLSTRLRRVLGTEVTLGAASSGTKREPKQRIRARESAAHALRRRLGTGR